jgi:hypothetical protein
VTQPCWHIVYLHHAFAAFNASESAEESKIERSEKPRREPSVSHFAARTPTQRLDRRLVRYGCDVLRLVLLQADSVCGTGLLGHALQLLGLASLLGLLLEGEVGLDALEEVLSRAGVADVLDADVDALLHVAVADLLLQDDADGRLGDVVDDTGLAVVDLVGHTLLDGTCAAVSPALPMCSIRGFSYRWLRHRRCHRPCTASGRWRAGSVGYSYQLRLLRGCGGLLTIPFFLKSLEKLHAVRYRRRRQYSAACTHA